MGETMNHANLAKSLVQLLGGFRQHDFVRFKAEHERLYDEAVRSGDHTEVVTHFYTVMADLLEAYYGTAWHFVPPEHAGQSRDEAIRGLHRRIAKLIDHEPGREALDVGCGIGSCMRGVALESGGRVTGITMGQYEVDEANALNASAHLDRLCTAKQVDFNAIPFEEGRFDSAYAVYSYKYSPSLKQAFGEVFRVLRPGGRFLVYDMMKADTFDENDPEHARAIDTFAYVCGMPPFLSSQQRIDEARLVGFDLLTEMDLSQAFPWYDHFVRPPILMKLVESKRLLGVVRWAERAGLLPEGFAPFYETFVVSNVASMVNGGKMGALTGSNLVVFQKPGGAS
jgi:cyclopropane fatty-acyl-phospholipid synthase-like methyltransferase